MQKGEHTPRKHGVGQKHKFPEENVTLMVELLAVKEKGAIFIMKDVQ
jgi:hypothetical protein